MKIYTIEQFNSKQNCVRFKKVRDFMVKNYFKKIKDEFDKKYLQPAFI